MDKDEIITMGAIFVLIFVAGWVSVSLLTEPNEEHAKYVNITIPENQTIDNQNNLNGYLMNSKYITQLQEVQK